MDSEPRAGCEGAAVLPSRPMLDPRVLADRRDEIASNCQQRGVNVDVAAAVAAHQRVTANQTELNDRNRSRNEHQKSGRKQLSPEEREAHVAEGRRLKESVAEIEKQLADAQAELNRLMATIPNFAHPDSPLGGEEDFRVLRTVGEPRRFDFTPLDHLEIAERFDLVDFESGAKVSGQKFYYLKNEAVLLDMALQRYALDLVMAKGFTPFITPDLARREIVDAMAFSPRDAATQIYSVADSDLDLIGTAEITLGGLYKDEIVDESELPIRLAGVSHCYRTEAGSAGRESKGLYRVHQFSKVEMFVLTRPEDSAAMHDEILAIEEKIFQDLEIPYRVIDVAVGDLGAPAYRKFDIEAWMPGRGESGDYGEVTSASNCTDFQARRLRARFRRTETKKNELLHTLNGTAVAVTRSMIPVLENHQNSDGSIAIPKALQPYMGLERIGPR